MRNLRIMFLLVLLLQIYIGVRFSIERSPYIDSRDSAFFTLNAVLDRINADLDNLNDVRP